jgi:hypothetical protein
MPNTFKLRAFLFAAMITLLVAGIAGAAPVVLTVGGGPSPLSNQLSLETNVHFFRQVLKDLGAGDWKQQTLFADGGVGDHTVQCQAEDSEDMTFLACIAAVVNNGPVMPLNQMYRKTDLTDISGPATYEGLEKWFTSTGDSIPTGSELLFYYTGHGGGDGSGINPPRNTTLALWDKPSMTMRQFATLMDKMDPSVNVMLVMVQCHSGGFANVIYTGGDPKNGLAKQLRFGFFSTTAPRMAAGCTNDIKGEDYREFSTAFFAALSGKTRLGQTVQRPSYGNDGKTTYMDAFTYVLLTSDTIDLPMTTSDLLLHDFSRYASVRPRRTAIGNASTQPIKATDLPTTPKLLGVEATYADIQGYCTPAQRAAIVGLGKILAIDPADPVTGAHKLRLQIEHDQAQARMAIQPLQQRYTQSLEKLRHLLLMRYPELADPWLPTSVTLRAPTNLPKLRGEISAMPEYHDFVQAAGAVGDAEEKMEGLDRKWIKAQRLIDRADTVILQANLPLVAPQDIQDRYKLLVEHEQGMLTADHL